MIALSLVVSGCSCTGDGSPADGNGNVNDGDGGTVIGGAIAAGVIVVLLVVAMVTGAVIVGILVWRRKVGNPRREGVQRSMLSQELLPTARKVPTNLKQCRRGSLLRC